MIKLNGDMKEGTSVLEDNAIKIDIDVWGSRGKKY